MNELTKNTDNFLFDLPYLAFALIDKNGKVKGASQNWNEFGFEIRPGDQIDRIVSAFWGLLPFKDPPFEIHLPLVISVNEKFLDFFVRSTPPYYLVCALDVTDKALALQELQQLRNELELFKRDYCPVPPQLEQSKGAGQIKLAQQAKNLIQTSKLAALGEMANGLSHEVYNPLMIIQGSIEIIERLSGPVNGDQADRILKYINKAKDAISRIVYIINGLKYFSRTDQEGPKEVVPLKTILDETFVICFEMLKSHKIEYLIDDVPDVLIKCSPLQITQVLFNIIKNADEALTLSDAPRKWIKVTFKESPTHVFIYVSDNGKPIPLKDQGKIFQPFFTTKDVGQGAGLGLAISRGIIQEHGGELILDVSAPETTFLILLPKHPIRDH